MVALALHASRGELRLRESGRGGAGRREWAQQESKCDVAILPYDARAGFGASRVRRQVRPKQLRTAIPQDRLSSAPCARVERKKHGDSNFSEHGRICEPRAWHTASGRRGPGGWCAFDDVRRTLTSPILRRSRGAFGAVRSHVPVRECPSVSPSQGLTRGSSGPRLRCDASAPIRVRYTHACAARWCGTARDRATAKSTSEVSTVEKSAI